MKTRPYLAPLCPVAALVALVPGASAKSQATPNVRIGGGKIGKDFWGAWAGRGEGIEARGPHAGRRPFLTVGVAHPSFGHTYFESDNGFGTGTPGHLSAKRDPLIVTNTASSEGKVAMTAVAMAFAPAAVRIELTYARGKPETIHLHRLNSFQSRKARLERFRYAAFAVRGVWCPERIVSFNATGAKLWDSGKEPCEGEESQYGSKS